MAEQVQTGNIPCELGARIKLVADAAKPGYFDLEGQGYRYRLHPVVSRTGAIRLEDVQRGAVWIQLANKSILMDQKNGRRLADDTPANRRRISRWMGLFFITVGSLAAFGALAVIRLG